MQPLVAFDRYVVFDRYAMGGDGHAAQRAADAVHGHGEERACHHHVAHLAEPKVVTEIPLRFYMFAQTPRFRSLKCGIVGKSQSLLTMRAASPRPPQSDTRVYFMIRRR
eukprot:SAG25_NODE_514_length_7279_cov_5.792758_5_plen_109_part_00